LHFESAGSIGLKLAAVNRETEIRFVVA